MRGRFARSPVKATAFVASAVLLLGDCRGAGSGVASVSFSAAPPEIAAYDFVELTATVAGQRAANPFADAQLAGTFESVNDSKRWSVDGFADASDGSTYRIRFMPPAPGEYRYSIEYRGQAGIRSTTGTFRAVDQHRKGILRVDPEYPWHFVWAGTGEHYFFNGTTAYWLFGWRDDSIVDASLERLHRLRVNRLRVTIAGRSNTFYGEPVVVGKNWTLYVTPWPATSPEDVYHPGFDFTRFDVAYWQKIERGLRYARDRDMSISLVLDMNDSQTHPAAGGVDERRFICYAVARLAAFSNVTWDLGDDLDGYRDAAWSEATGDLIHGIDPYQHLTTTHPRAGTKSVEQSRQAAWVGFASYQNWTRTQHAFMLEQRKRQQALGRIIPQTNEEYGYEDHYPLWSPRPDAESPDVLRRMAWEIAMAGGYGTTGETAKRGTNIWPDSGGGWINGRGDSTMTMLRGYAHLVYFFTAFDWWRTNPHDELVTGGAYALAEPGRTYVVYLPRGAAATLRLAPGTYRARSFDPRTGQWADLPDAAGGSWHISAAPRNGDDVAVLLIRR